jgi:hypothetical protein
MGTPHKPKPPTQMVAPSRMSATASNGLMNTLSGGTDEVSRFEHHDLAQVPDDVVSAEDCRATPRAGPGRLWGARSTS